MIARHVCTHGRRQIFGGLPPRAHLHTMSWVPKPWSVGALGALVKGLAVISLAGGTCAIIPASFTFVRAPAPAVAHRAGVSRFVEALPSGNGSSGSFILRWSLLTALSRGRRGDEELSQPFKLRSTSTAFPVEESPDESGESSESHRRVAKESTSEKVRGYSSAIYKFTRPHTIRGTVLGSFTGVTRALIESPHAISLSLVPRAVLGLLSLLLGNAFIVGINQIYDVEIDKINKPDLPVASGAMSKRLAWGLVLGSLATGPAIVLKNFSPLIFRLYSFGLLVGALSSVPPFSLKRFPVAAGLIIACVRGFLLNFGVYYAVREALGLEFRWNPAVLFLARFMTVFAGVIAVTKDLPDVKGDRKYKISTFASKKGVKFTARAACAVLALNYVSAIVQGSLSPAGAFNKRVMVGGHALLLVGLGASLRRLVPDSQESIKAFYKRIWDLFYLEYVLYPFI